MKSVEKSAKSVGKCVRISWDENDYSKKLLKIVINEASKGGTKYNWVNIVKIFNAQTNLRAKQSQLRNQLHGLKEKYKCWLELQKMSGISFDPDTNEVDVAETSLERYEAFLEVKLFVELQILYASI